DDRLAASIAAFRARASRLRSTAFAILGVIFLLLVGGATVFVLAPQLTLADLYPQILTKRSVRSPTSAKSFGLNFSTMPQQPSRRLRRRLRNMITQKGASSLVVY